MEVVMNQQEWLNADNPDLLLDAITETQCRRELQLFGCACCRDIWHLLPGIRSQRAVEQAEVHADQQLAANEADVIWNEAHEARSVIAAEHDSHLGSLRMMIRSIWSANRQGSILRRDITDAQLASEVFAEDLLCVFGIPFVSTAADARNEWLNEFKRHYEGQVLTKSEYNHLIRLFHLLTEELTSGEGNALVRYAEAERLTSSQSFAAAAASRLAWSAQADSQVISSMKQVAKYAASAKCVQKERGYQCVLLREIMGNPFGTHPINASWLEWNSGAISREAGRIYQDRHFRGLPRIGEMLKSAGCNDQEIVAHCFSDTNHILGCWVIDTILDKRQGRQSLATK
jgi:hypothetical protein